MASADPIPLGFTKISRALRDFSFPAADAVVGIREGGVVPAALVAHQLGLPCFLIAINYRAPDNSPRYVEPKLLTEPRPLPPEGSRILLIDDVSVSGKTLETARRCLPGREIQTFTLKGRAADFVLFPEIKPCVIWPWKAPD